MATPDVKIRNTNLQVFTISVGVGLYNCKQNVSTTQTAYCQLILNGDMG